jgi:hypothetical protein
MTPSRRTPPRTVRHGSAQVRCHRGASHRRVADARAAVHRACRWTGVARIPDLPCGPAAGGAVRAVHAGSPPAQIVNDAPANVGGHRVLPNLRHRRRTRPLASRVCPPTQRLTGDTDHGTNHLQLEALLSAAGDSTIASDSPWFACLAWSGCGSSKPPARTSVTSARNTATARCAWSAKAERSSVPLPPAVTPGQSTEQLTGGPAGRCCATPAAGRWTATPTPAGCEPLSPRAVSESVRCTRTRSGKPLSPPCSTPVSTPGTRRSPPATPTRGRPCATTVPATMSIADPNYILAAYIAPGT